MDNKKVIAGVVVLGILSYLGYQMFKELNSFELDDDIWNDLDDLYPHKAEGVGG